MPRQLHILTDIQLRQWIKQGASVAKADGGGLTFTLSQAGTATWILRYRSNGKRRELTLGNYPDISLSEARKLASQHRAAVDVGQDPAKDKAIRRKKEATPEWTIKSLAEDYRAKRLVSGSFAAGTLYYRNADLNNVLIPRLGSRPVASVTGPDIVQMLRDADDTWTISKRVLTTASKLFEHAAGLHIININPCAGVSLTSLLGPRPPVKKRVMLTTEDLRALLATVDTLGTENGLALRILLATCVRTNELVTARWENIDLDNGSWFVPNESTKTRTGFLVPLAPAAVNWFRELHDFAGGSPFVLPARVARKVGQPITTRTLWAAITRAFETGRLTVTKFTPHDTRSTAKGHMRNLGISEYDTERALSHVIGGVSGVYDVRQELPEKRRALQVWADFLLSLSTDAPNEMQKQQPQATPKQPPVKAMPSDAALTLA
jgi:integrase